MSNTTKLPKVLELISRTEWMKERSHSGYLRHGSFIKIPILVNKIHFQANLSFNLNQTWHDSYTRTRLHFYQFRFHGDGHVTTIIAFNRTTKVVIFACSAHSDEPASI